MAKKAAKKAPKKVMAKKSMKTVKGKSGLCDSWFQVKSTPKPTTTTSTTSKCIG